MFNLFSGLSGDSLIVAIVATVLAVVLSLSLHEFAHAFVAHKQGDMTPKVQGRLTLNPLAHIDIVGFLLIVIVGFGWAKPVQVNPLKFKNYKKGMFNVSIAGVIVNFALFIISYPLLYLLISFGSGLPVLLFKFLNYFLLYMVTINIVLAVFNLVPIFPLDGYRIVEIYAKPENAYVKLMNKYGTLILLGFVLFLNIFDVIGLVGSLVSQPIINLWNLIFRMFGI